MSSTNKTSHYNLPQFIGSDIPTWLGDFNSAMTAIDSGINAAATTASGAATTAAQALEAVNRCPFPIGYGGFFQIDPNTLYKSTTWEQKKDVFILAAGDTYPAGSTGGEAQHTLTKAEMPAHAHVIAGAEAEAPDGSDFAPWSAIASGNTGISGGRYNGVGTYENGDGQPHNNMPPYFAMPFWIRTA